MVPKTIYILTEDYTYNTSYSSNCGDEVGTSTSDFYLYHNYGYNCSFDDLDHMRYLLNVKKEREKSGRKLISDYFNNLQLVLIKNMEYIICPLFKPKLRSFL